MDHIEEKEALDSGFKFEGKIKLICIAILVIAFAWGVLYTGEDLIGDILWYILTFFVSPYFLTKIWNISIADFYGLKKVNYYWSLSIVCALWIIM